MAKRQDSIISLHKNLKLRDFFLIVAGLKKMSLLIFKSILSQRSFPYTTLFHQAIGLDQKQVSKFRDAVEGEKKIE